jgi:nucleoside-diphosphate-sugar epimerase
MAGIGPLIMRSVVTGGAGFIGHHLVSNLAAQGHGVTVLDNFITGDVKRLAPLGTAIRVLPGDVRDPDALRAAMDGAEAVFHLAALPSVARSIAEPALTNDINVGGTIAVMTAAASAGVRRVVLAGSSSVYGSNPELPRRESQIPNPQSPYAVSKLAAELYATTLGTLMGVQAVVLRYFNVFGPGQDPFSPYAAVVPRFVTAALAGQQPAVNGDGTQSRDFTYVDNVVAATVLAATAPTAAGRTFNVGCGVSYTLLDLIAAIGEATGTRLEPTFGPPVAGDVKDSLADISLASQHLGYRPHVDFRRGVTLTVESFRNPGGAGPPND